MALTLYGLGASRSFRCLWALEEAGLNYDYINLDLASSDEGGAKSAHYLALNSQGKVPTLVHDDLVLTESAAILNYINTLADDRFAPIDAKTRAKYDELAFFVLSELEQPLWTTGKHKFAIPAEHRVPDVLNTTQWEFEKAINALNNILSLNDDSDKQLTFALGEEFSFADILLAQTINWADKFKFQLPDAYLTFRDSMYARPAVEKAQAKFA